MATRSYDWSPLKLSSDPIPGDPEAVWDAASSLRQTATDIENACEGMKDASTDGIALAEESEAVDEFTNKATEVADKLAKAQPRYEVAAEALSTYYWELLEAQSKSVQALHMAEDAEHLAQQEAAADEQAKNDAAKNDTPLPTPLPGPSPSEQKMAAALALLQQAIEVRDSGAESAANKIENKIENDDVKDSIWDNLSKLGDILSTISTVLGIAAMLVQFIPVIGQVLGAALGALALITGLLALIIHIGVALDNGEGWDAVIFDAIGVLTFGVGRAAIGGAKTAALASRSLAWSKLSRQGGAVASRLSAGTFGFASKGPMTLSAARAVMRGGAIPKPIAAAFGGLGGDIAGGWRALRAPGLLTHLRATPGELRNIPSLFSSGKLPFVLQGEAGAFDALQGIQGLRGFEDVAGLTRALNLETAALTYTKWANTAFATGTAGTILDNIGVDIPLVK